MENVSDKEIIQEELIEDEKLQLAENKDVDNGLKETINNEFVEKRELLNKTKIVKQTWSISEIYQKIKEKKLILDPDYQRRVIWNNEKKTAFIESLYMEIMIPPIYVVEIPGKNILEENKYEVVDGKQRLTAIMDFIKGSLKLDSRHLEYFGDLYGDKSFAEINEIDSERTTQMLSSVLDIYVITSNSPEFTKYDIFARLNKGAEKLKVNEIRRAIYRSQVTEWITEFVEEQIKNNSENYYKIFTANDIKRFEDYGRFYRSIAFYLCSDIEKSVVVGYNSRPREMINSVLQDLQKQKREILHEDVKEILSKTLNLELIMMDDPNKEYIIDALMPFVNDKTIDMMEVVEKIRCDEDVLKTFEKSPATTSNVNARLTRVGDVIRS